MIGVITNSLTIIAGSIFGMIFKKYIPKNLGDMLMKALGLCVIYIGISGAFKCENSLILILSMVIGTVIGTLLKFEDRFNAFSEKIGEKLSKNNKNVNFSEGFVNASLLFCVGAMAVVGSLQAGISNDNTLLFTKSLLDGVSSIVFSSTLGIGVLFSSVAVFVYQGAIALFASVIAPFLTDSCVNEMTASGSLLIMAIGFNMLKITKIKIMDMLPAVFVPILLCLFM